jgi:hypothetical protein
VTLEGAAPRPLLRYGRGVRSTYRRLGFAGSLAVAVGGFGAGALPASVAVPPGLSNAASALTFLGLTLLVAAWLLLGRLVAAGDTRPRDLVVTLVWWTAPLMLAPPMYSRDIYSYFAQGMISVQGMDPYEVGPAVLGGTLARDIAPIWLHTPAPYGPLFLTAAAGVMRVAGNHTVLAALGMRALALAGLALLAYGVPRLARRSAASATGALWLGVLNPLVLAHLVAGAHNDALMVAFLVGGLLLAVRGRPALGTVVVTLAVLIKAPAVIALGFLVPLWADRLRQRRPVAIAIAVAGTAVAAAGTIVAVTTLAGAGYGWIGRLRSPGVVRNGLSITTDLGVLSGRLTHLVTGVDGEPAVMTWRAAGTVIALAVTAVLLWRALQALPRILPAHAFGLAMSVIVLLSPVVHPWYLLWGFVPLAATNGDRRVRATVVVLSVVAAYAVMPDGGSRTGPHLLAGAVGLLLGLLGLFLGRRRLGLPQRLGEVLQRQPVPVDAEPADHPGRDGGDHRVVPELLTRVDVGDVHLDQGRPQQGAGVAQRIGVVRPGAGVEHDRGGLVGGGVQPAEHLGLVVGLPHSDVEAQRRTVADAAVDQVGVGGEPVDVDLAGAQPAEVGTVEHVDLHPGSPISAKAARSMASSGESRMDGAASPSSTTNRSRPPRAFLSTRMTDRNSGQADAE